MNKPRTHQIRQIYSHVALHVRLYLLSRNLQSVLTAKEHLSGATGEAFTFSEIISKINGFWWMEWASNALGLYSAVSCALFLLPKCWEHSTNVLLFAKAYVLLVGNDGCGGSCPWAGLCDSNLEIVMESPDESPALSSLLFALFSLLFGTTEWICFTLTAATLVTGSRTKERSKRKKSSAFMWGFCWDHANVTLA